VQRQKAERHRDLRRVETLEQLALGVLSPATDDSDIYIIF
jgi:hypothetical protein